MDDLSFLLKKGLHKGAALVGEDAGSDGCLGVESARRIGGVAAFGIGCTVDDAAYLCPTDGARAHSAGFDGDIESSIGQVLAAKRLCSGRDGLNLRMSGDVGKRLGEVMTATDDASLGDDDAADGNLVGSEGFFGLQQR